MGRAKKQIKKKLEKAEKKKSAIQAGAAVASNKKAAFDYKLGDSVVAGIVLTGTEVKSLRNGEAQLKGSYAKIVGGEAFLFNCHIPEYKHGNRNNHDPWRVRKLLLHKRQIEKLDLEMHKTKQTLVVTRIFFKNNYAKANLALAEGKKKHDKRESMKRKDQDREMQRAMKRSF